MKPVPGWWCNSELVVGLNGEQGILSDQVWSIDQDSGWSVTAEDGSRVWVNPDPSYWLKRPAPQIGHAQLRRILYECDRAFVASLGRSSMTEWISLPESQRTGSAAPKCCPVDDSQQGTLRRLIEHAVETALKQYVTPY